MTITTNHTSRRDILKAAGAGIVTMALPFPVNLAFAGETRKPTIVILYLRGGMDALNVIVPRKSQQYRDLRPTLALPVEGEGAIIPLDSKFGLHPSLGALKPFFDAGKVAPVVNVGSPHATRSHFDAQDFMEYAAPGMRTVRDGWLNRYLALSDPGEAATMRALAMQGLLPRSLRGKYAVLAVPERKVLRDKKMLKAFGELYGEGGGTMERDEDGTGGVVEAGRYTAETLKRLQEIIGSERGRRAVSYPKSRLGAKLRAIAQVIRSGEGLEVAAIDINGWDTHANQGTTDGAMPGLMQDLGDSVAAFMNHLGDHLDNTLIVTMTATTATAVACS